MKALIVCKSYHHGNTRKVAETIGEVLNAEIVKPGEKPSSSIRDYDLLGLGSGIYWARFHGDIFDSVENLPEVEGKKAFIFSTSGMRKVPIINGFGGGIKDKLLEKGFEIIGEFSCRGYDTFFLFKLVGGIQKGRPNEEDLRGAKKFAERMSERAETDSKNEREP
ncbi:hypothetical protein AKJ41_03300 [candidate division MSBL1 archaeon SCGC-AAA259O05]|uniref:Flavodoxin domain-containing protein n=1 Tax=candidate division MSBL1 archaeon SCGC-AAA259O05 TaxID=1698271 RepID=A0A133V3B6_9EURY|nr:hypothetical protein AKJ41_03300 [candidate division MSBL1 archaeon SCGC-AAA259O05]